MKSLITTTLATAIVCLSCHAQDDDKGKGEGKGDPPKGAKPKIEWKVIDAAEFAQKLQKSTAAGEKWTRSPESIMLEYVGPFVSKDGEKAATSRTIRIKTTGEEVPKILNVIVIDDGLFDDSTKTQRTRLALARNDDGTWKLRTASESLVKWPRPGA